MPDLNMPVPMASLGSLSFLSLSGYTVTVHVKASGGGGKNSKVKERRPEDSSNLSFFLVAGGSTLDLFGLF